MRWHKQTVDIGGVRLAVRDSGGNGTTAVLLHGLGAPQRSWDRVTPLLAPHLRVVTYDQRGHGASAAADDYSLDAFLADLQAVLDTLALQQPLLVGHSFGGLLAVDHAAAHPGCAGVVAVDGGLKVERPPVGWADVQAQLDRPVTRLLSRAVTAIGMARGCRPPSCGEWLTRPPGEKTIWRRRTGGGPARCWWCWPTRPTRCPTARRCWPRWTPPPPASSSAIRRSSWHGCRAVTTSHSRGQGSWLTSLSASLNSPQLSSEYPPKAGQQEGCTWTAVHPIPSAFTDRHDRVCPDFR